MASDQTQVTLRDLLYELAIDADDPQALRRLMNEHPEHAEALAQYAQDMVDDGDPEPNIDDADEDRINQLVNPAMSRYQDRLYDQQHPAQPKAPAMTRADAPPAADPFAALGPKEFRTLARRLDVNSLFLTKIRDRLIKPETIPGRFSTEVAEALGSPHPAFVAHQAQHPRAPPGHRFMADEKPTVGRQQTWEDAVRSSSLTEEQQKKLLP